MAGQQSAETRSAEDAVAPKKSGATAQSKNAAKPTRKRRSVRRKPTSNGNAPNTESKAAQSKKESPQPAQATSNSTASGPSKNGAKSASNESAAGGSDKKETTATAAGAADARKPAQRRRRRSRSGPSKAEGADQSPKTAESKDAASLKSDAGASAAESVKRPGESTRTELKPSTPPPISQPPVKKPMDDFAAGLESDDARPESRSAPGAAAAGSADAANRTSDTKSGSSTSSAEEEAQRAAKLVLKKRPARRAGKRRRKSASAKAESEDSADAQNSTFARTAAKAPEASTSSAAPPAARQIPVPEKSSEEIAPKKPARNRPARRRKKATSKSTAETAATSASSAAGKTANEASPDDADNESPGANLDNIEVFDPTNPPKKSTNREMIINMTAGAECRIAILSGGRLEELYIERQSAESHVGNIYKGVITNVEPSIQAAFVDFGLAKNGFLHISDVQPRYFPSGYDETEDVGRKVPRRERPPIQKCFRRGDKVIVQVAKEGVGTKGPTLTTYLAIPGRFLVMMPGMNKLGVSRKIEDETIRREMRKVLGELTLPDGIGFILRTAGQDRTKRDLQSDLNYLSRLWKTVDSRITRTKAPCELYQESDLVIRTIRDVYSSDFDRVVVDSPQTAEKARDFLRIAAPRSSGAVMVYDGGTPIFHYFGIEEEIQQIHARKVPLRSGGSIVIDSTEAMVAIDVNSGKFRELQDAEETAYRINLEAAEEIARQLRLRDLGGLVVCDFIDMRMDKHKRAVEKALRDALRKHKERARILRMSKFGLIEMTRQRQRPSIKRSVFYDCPHCNGSGLIKTPESMSLEIVRVLQLLTHRKGVRKITMSVAPPVASLVLNQRRRHLYELEQKSGALINIRTDAALTLDQYSFQCEDDRQMPLQIEL